MNDDDSNMEQTDGELLMNPNSSDNTRVRGLKPGNAIEVLLVLAFFSVMLGGATVSNLIMYRTCVHSLSHSEAECRSFLEPEAIDHSPELEKEVQEYAAMVGTVKSVLEALGPAVLSLFIGGWSDRYGRKPLLVWPILGITFSTMLLVVYGMLDNLGPWWIVLTSIPHTLTGGYGVMVTGAMCYVTDITTKEKRSVNILVIEATIVVATALGTLASPYLLRSVGTVYLMLVQATIFTVAYAFTNVCIEESLGNAEQGTIWMVFNSSHVKGMLRVCFKEKPNFGRAVILLIVATNTFSYFTLTGGQNLIYMYTRAKIQWTMKDYNIFSSVSRVLWFVGSLVGIAGIQKALRISDLNFSAFAFFSRIIEYLTKGLATKTWHMYFGSAISLFGSTPSPLIRSFLTKNVPAEDIAKVFGLMNSVDSVVSLLSPIVYNALYAATISAFPPAAMLLTSFINTICFALILNVQYLRSRQTTAGYQTVPEES